jgi:predicted transcriptional regulator
MEIIATILKVTKKQSTKTKIMFSAYLSYAQLTNYLKFLQENDMIVHDGDAKLYRTTKKGLKFLDKYNMIGDVMTVGQRYKSFSNSE